MHYAGHYTLVKSSGLNNFIIYFTTVLLYTYATDVSAALDTINFLHLRNPQHFGGINFPFLHEGREQPDQW
jgi:hypothetical protein